MKTCPNCNTTIEDNVNFCSNCGFDFTKINNIENNTYDESINEIDNLFSEINDKKEEIYVDTIVKNKYQQSNIEKRKVYRKRTLITLTEQFYGITKGICSFLNGSLLMTITFFLLFGKFRNLKILRIPLSILTVSGLYILIKKYFLPLEDFREYVYEWFMIRENVDLPPTYEEYKKVVTKDAKNTIGPVTILFYAYLFIALFVSFLSIVGIPSIIAADFIATGFAFSVLGIGLTIFMRRRLKQIRSGH